MSQSTNNPFLVEEEDSLPTTSRVSKEKPAAAQKKKAVKKCKKVSQKKKPELHKSPFASETESDSDGPSVVAPPAPKRKRNTIVSESDDELSRPVIRASTLKSSFTQRMANGSTYQSDPGRVGKYYFELRVFNTDEVEKLAYNERYKQSLVTLKLSINKDDIVWKAVTHLVSTGKAEFKDIQPILYS